MFTRLLRYWNNWKLLTFRKLFYLPHILTSREKRVFGIFILASVISLCALSIRIYVALTHPVPAIGGTYTEGMLKQPRLINPVYAANDADRDIVRLVFSGLLAYNGEGMLKTDLADSYEIDQDARIYTVTIKKNIVWHDGIPLDAEDILFTIKAIQNPQYKSPLRSNWQGVQVEKLDRYTIRFVLRAPYAPFIENLTVGILPRHLWEHLPPEQTGLHELNIKPIGSGPYRFDTFQQNTDGSFQWYQLIRNTDYYESDRPYLKKIVLYFFPDEDALIGAWRRGDIDGFGPVAPAQIPESSRRESVILSIQVPRIFGIFFNQTRAPILADQTIREAMELALDKKEIAEHTVSGGATPLDAPLPWFEDRAASSSAPLNGYDPERAKQILEQAGWKDLNGDGIREKEVKQKAAKPAKNTKRAVSQEPKKSGDPVPLRFTLMTSDWPDLVQTAGKIKDMLGKVGIEVVVEKKTFADLESSVIRPRNFEILLFGQAYGYEPDPFAFWHSSQIKDPGLNVALYANQKIDKLLEEARLANTPGAREKKLRAFSDSLSRDIPAIFLFSQLYFYLLPSDLKGIHITKISLPADRLSGIAEWYRKQRRVFKR